MQVFVKITTTSFHTLHKFPTDCLLLLLFSFPVAPIIKVPNQLVGAPLGTDVQLECFVEAFPNTINYWIKNRGEMLLNGYVELQIRKIHCC